MTIGGKQKTRIIDPQSPPLDALFSEQTSSFTIAVQIPESGLTAASFVYDFTAAGGHGIIIGNEVLLLDTAADRFFFAIVLNVVVNVITIDRPIDHTFPIASTLGRIVTTNMNVDGSVTPRVFTVRAGTTPLVNTRFILTMTNTSAMDSGTFGGLAALTRGLVFRIFNGYQRTVFCFKTNQEIKQFCYDGDYDDRAPAGQFGFFARISFAGPDKHGVSIRISTNDVLQWVVQDNLTGLLTLRVSTEGHELGD
jgi:hypothetical protein